MKSKIKKPACRTVIECSLTDRKVKGVIAFKSDQKLVVDLPSGFQMTLERSRQARVYVYRVGTLEFVSDGWPVV